MRQLRNRLPTWRLLRLSADIPPIPRADAPVVDVSRGPLPPPLRPDAGLAILDITKHFAETTGGIRTYLLAKAAYVEARPELRQVLVVPGATGAIGQAAGARCYQVPGRPIPTQSPYRFLLDAATIRGIIEHERPDLIEVGSPFAVPWVTRRANSRHRAPMVWFFHTDVPGIVAPRGAADGAARTLGGKAAWAYFRLLGRQFHAVLAASETVAQALERNGVERVARVTLGVDLDRFHPSRRAVASDTRRTWGLPEGPLGLFVGRLAREKQIDILFRAWPEIRRRTGATLVLAGNGPSAGHYRRMAPSDGVVWLPYQHDRDRLADLYAAADLYLAPGPAETFGLSALEAFASGTPVLSVDRGGVAELLTASGAGLHYPSGDAGACAEAAIRLFQGDLPALGRRGRQHAETRHSWNTAFGRIFAVYREVLDRA